MVRHRQTIRLVSRDPAKLQTKLRHVDIHNHWMEEAVAQKQVLVEYTPIADMLADGLTQALSVDMFRKFRALVGIMDVTEQIKGRKLKKVTNEDLEALDDAWEGGD